MTKGNVGEKEKQRLGEEREREGTSDRALLRFLVQPK